MKRKIILIVLMIIASGYMLVSRFYNSDNISETIVINEVVPDNFSLQSDGYGNYLDIVELYNRSDKAVSLKDYGLSDDSDIIHKWNFPDVTIESGEYLLIYMAGEEAEELDLVNDAIYCDFKMSSMGEKLILSDVNGEVLDSLSYDRVKENMSYGRSNSGYSYFLWGTPGYYNESVVVDDVDLLFKDFEINPSFEPGIYDEPIELVFDDQYSDKYQLKYTLDCSNPSTASLTYQEPISIGYTDELTIRISNIPTSYYPLSELDED